MKKALLPLLLPLMLIFALPAQAARGTGQGAVA
jgi:hypothetical protein